VVRTGDAGAAGGVAVDLGGQGDQAEYERAPPLLTKVLPDPAPTVLIVQNSDGFTRFGVGRMASSLTACVLRILIFNAEAIDGLVSGALRLSRHCVPPVPTPAASRKAAMAGAIPPART
jgi:hypothetical protein